MLFDAQRGVGAEAVGLRLGGHQRAFRRRGVRDRSVTEMAVSAGKVLRGPEGQPAPFLGVISQPGVSSWSSAWTSLRWPAPG